jgi:hypothetical protein
VGVLRQDGQGGLAPIDWVEPNFLFAAWSLAIGDLNGDGRPDLAVGAGGNLPNTALRIYHQQADGRLAQPLDLPTYQAPTVLRLADADGDGRLDVVISHLAYFRVGVYLQGAQGLGNEHLYPADTGNVFRPALLALGDLNQDGRTDIAIDRNLLLQRDAVPAVAPASARQRAAGLPRAAIAAGPAAKRAASVAPGLQGRSQPKLIQRIVQQLDTASTRPSHKETPGRPKFH